MPDEVRIDKWLWAVRLYNSRSLATDACVAGHVKIAGQQVIFGFTGSDDAQADLIEGLTRLGIRMRAFEEKRSSFEDILVEVAENNRRA